MMLSSPSRFCAALFTLFCLLFTQLAVASHVCPETTTAMSAALSHADMPGCDMGMDRDMDQPEPGMCQAHCNMGHQSLETAGTPPVPPFIAAGLTVVLAGDNAATERALPDAARRARTTAPPIAIRNCCFRI